DCERARRESPAGRSLLSPQHFSNRDPPVARAEGRYPAPGLYVFEAIRHGIEQTRAGDCSGSVPKAARLFLARKRPRIAERDGIRRCPRPEGKDHGERIAGGGAVARGAPAGGAKQQWRDWHPKSG